MTRKNVDAMLRDVLLRRHLEALEQGQASGQIVNNVYGGGGGAPDMGMRGQMLPDAEDDGDYMVDITRQDLPTGDGWTKKVHRYRQPKGGDANPPAKAGGKKKAHRYRPE
jgi:hypothetical protein